MLKFRPYWILGIILAVSFTYALPSNAPPNHVLDPRASSALTVSINGKELNSTTQQCVATVGLKISKFFIFNYIGHAFTIKPGAGYKSTYVLVLALAAVFLPYYGLMLACRNIEYCPAQEKNTLKCAARGGALCVVARTKKWRPREGDTAWCWRSVPTGDIEGEAEIVHYAGLELEYLSQEHVQIHGTCHLPPVPEGSEPEYMLARLPPDYEVEWELKFSDEESSVSSDYSIIRPVMAFFQLLSAVPVIYGANKSESQQHHGYAGYQLTIIPFALMSIINTCASMAGPNYGSSYMVRSSIMEEAESRGARFEGVVGRLCESERKIVLKSPVDNHGNITGEIGKFEGADAEILNFNDPNDRLRYPAKKLPKQHNRFSRAVTRANHFIFRQHIWEAVREEFPVLRWFLFRSECKRLEEILASPENQVSPTGQPSRVNEPEATDPTGKRESTQINQTGLLETRDPNPPRAIARLNPQRTCINRLFKRYSERKLPGDKTKTKAMILSPAIGNPVPRQRSSLEKFLYYFTDIVFVVSIAAPYLITYGLTGYRPGQSDVFQRVVVVLWLVMMQIACIPQRVTWNFLQTRLASLGSKAVSWGLAVIIILGAIWSTPGVLGFFVVLRLMINDNKDACSGAFGDLMNLTGLGTEA